MQIPYRHFRRIVLEKPLKIHFLHNIFNFKIQPLPIPIQCLKTVQVLLDVILHVLAHSQLHNLRSLFIVLNFVF